MTMDRTRPDRVPPIDLEAMTPAQRDVFARIHESRGSVEGPFTMLLHVPELADRVQRLGAYLRYETALDGDLAETAVLATSRAWGNAFEWETHEPLARRAGVPDVVVEALRADADFSPLPDRYRIVGAYARELARSGHVPDEVYEASNALLGRSATVELTVLVGYYTLLAMTLNAHRVGLGDSRSPAGELTEAG
jgi:4-carboxymuconolactone decarboxylase